MHRVYAKYFGSVVAGLTLVASVAVFGSADAAPLAAPAFAPAAGTQSDDVVRVGRGTGDNKKCPRSMDNECTKLPPPPRPTPTPQ